MNSPELEKIIAFPGDAAVHASAGTGKTHLLVEKFLATLAVENGGRFTPIEGILAITFTEKAADEMRRRISQKLLDRTMELTSGEERADARLARHFTASRRRLSQAYVSTIHSFCARVLRENPIEAGIDPHFEIMDERRSSSLLAGALGNYLLEKVRGKDHAVSDLAYRYGFGRRGEFESSLATILYRLFPLMRAADMTPDGLMAEYRSFVPRAPALLAEALAEARRMFSAAMDAANGPAARAKLGPLAEALEGVEAVAEKDRGEGLRRAKMAAALVNARTVPKAATELKRLRELLGDAGDILAALQSEPAAGELARLAGDFKRHYSQNIKSADLLDFDDLQETTLRLFRRNAALRGAYRAKFISVMVDEFQDVNQLQMELLSMIAAPGEGKLFIVGDPKQAIYGFRGGDVEVFDEAKRAITEMRGAIFPQDTNRRSVAELVDFANDFFGAHGDGVFSTLDVCAPLKDPAGAPAVERLSFPLQEKADDNRFMEAGAIADRIQNMVAAGQSSYGEIVVLFRKFTQLPLYESVFRAFGVPFTVHRGAGFFESREVADLISVLAFIDDPLDTVSWAAALRSPFAGCADDTLLALRRGPDGRIVRTDRMSPAAIQDPAERDKFTRFIEWTERLRARKDRMLISEVMESVFAESGIAGILGAQPDGVQKTANAQKLIEIARSMESAGTATLRNFVREMTALSDEGTDEPQAVFAGKDANTVTVMTVHQAKGLEFPVVFLPDIDAEGSGFPSPVEFHQRRGFGLKYVDNSTLSATAGAVYAGIKKLNAKKRADDAMRLFYVACTRAKRHLVLSGAPMKQNNSSGLFAKIAQLQAEKPHHFAPEHPFDKKFPLFTPPPCAYDTLHSLTPDDGAWEDEPPPGAKEGNMALPFDRLATFLRCEREYLFKHVYKLEASVPVRKKSAQKTDAPAAEGNAVHALLQLLDFNLSESEWTRAAEARAETALAKLSPASRRKALRTVKELHAEGLFAEMRDAGAKSAREIPFWLKLPVDGKEFFISGRIDLLARAPDGRVYLADYKYSEGPYGPAAKKQLQVYALAVAGETGETRIACALLYLKNKRFDTWLETSGSLADAEGDLRDDLRRLAVFEDEAVRNPEGLAKKPIECPNRHCAHRPFCFP